MFPAWVWVDTRYVFRSRYLFVINDGKVHAYSASTGELAARLETPSGIVAVSPEPSNPRQLVTSDAAGGMVLWDFLLGTSLKVRYEPWLETAGWVSGWMSLNVLRWQRRVKTDIRCRYVLV